MKKTWIHFVLVLVFAFSHFCNKSYSQISSVENHIVTPFNEYTKIPREVVYVHLNKNVLIKGETLGFAAYVFDKNSKQLSANSTNLYCTIIDSENKIIKNKLIRVENGVADGQFFIDSLFTSENYTLKAYTNWMRNFEERNFYSQSFEVIDAEVTQEIKAKIISNKVDAQFLPEGGHYVSETENSVGVVIKDSLGYGIPNVEGRILNKEGLEFTIFKTNELGIGKFLYIPKTGVSYFAEFEINNHKHLQAIPFSHTKGIAIKLTDLGNKIAVTFNTNKQSLPEIKNRTFSLTIHNGKLLRLVEIKFSEELQVTKVLDYKDLFTGINIITLFDDTQKPILERLYFKYDGINILESGNVSTTKDVDSIRISLPIKKLSPKAMNSFSVSILPKGTKSYGPQHNVSSWIYLQPYINGFIENGAYYFQDIDRKKKYDLDLLLLTQGWSSYDWNFMFSNPPKPLYDFEVGISVSANVTRKASGQYLIYPTSGSDSSILNLEGNDTSFKLTDFFPADEEKLKIGEIVKNGKVEKPYLYLTFKPSKVPDFRLNFNVLKSRGETFMAYSNSEVFQSSWEKIEELREVVIKANIESTRLEKIKGRFQGSVDVFDDDKRNQFIDIGSYLLTKGFNVVNTGSTVSIVNNTGGKNNQVPLIYLDNILLFDFAILLNQPMNTVDYIVVDRNGFGQGLRGNAGVIKIYTDPMLSPDRFYGKNYQEYKVPLSYSAKKRFYTPVYSLYSSPFYKEFGVVGWLSNLSTDVNGFLNFQIQNIPISKVNLYIEGVTEDGSLLSEKKTIKIH